MIMGKWFLYISFFICFTNDFNYAQMTPTYVVSIPMRDGKFLAADVYVPSGCSNCPTILIQTPYNKNSFRNGLPLGYLQNVNSSPYCWVVVDWRGFYGSVAATIASPQRGQDGYDVIDWIVSQSWSNDKVGTWGPSALGVIQYQTAKENHPNHTCAVPMVAQPQTAYDGYFYGGVLEKSRLEQLDALGYGLSTTILANTYYSPTWQFTETSTWYPSSIKIPTLQIGGWYDHNIDDMVDWYPASRTSSDIPVRDKQWFLIGPWVHGGTGAAYVGSSIQGELTYPMAAQKCDSMARDFFQFYLLNNSNGWEATSPITYYELGKDSWAYSNATSIENLNTRNLFFKENGTLDLQTGVGSTPFVVDPKNPSPTLGGSTLKAGLAQGPLDQISLEGRSDLITFSTPILEVEASVSGRIKLDMFVDCDQPDADIAIRLVDVYPDGRNMLINDGIRRMRFRNGYTLANEVFMTPGNVYNVEVELPFLNYTWKAGHQLKVYVSGNNSTRWDVNLQNGSTMYVAGDTNTATIQLYHNSAYPSKIILPCDFLVVGTEELNSNNQILIYPNPVTSSISLTNVGIQNEYEISDTEGRLVMKGVNLNNSIDVLQLQSGVYFIKIKNDIRSTISRFIKK
jgi:predicted acyl esterase